MTQRFTRMRAELFAQYNAPGTTVYSRKDLARRLVDIDATLKTMDTVKIRILNKEADAMMAEVDAVIGTVERGGRTKEDDVVDRIYAKRKLADERCETEDDEDATEAIKRFLEENPVGTIAKSANVAYDEDEDEEEEDFM